MKPLIAVGNTYDHCGGEYIGRGSPLGNPFTHTKGTRALFMVSSRDEAVNKYEVYLNGKIANDDPVIIKELERLAEIAMKGPLVLRCFCAPKRCHGDVIKKVLETAIINHTE